MSNPRKDIDPESAVKCLLKYIGEDITREGLVDTPKRVIKSYKEIFAGYGQTAEQHMTVFEDDTCDEMVVLRDIEFYSTCLVGSTFIETPRGRIPISKLKDGEFVYCWDEEEWTLKLARCVNPRITGRNKILYRVYTDKDSVLCTGNHKFLTNNRGWVQAKNLTPGDSIVALNKGTILQNGKARPHLNHPSIKIQIPEHRFVYEQLNGVVDVGDHIHHIDRNPGNNDPSNLTAMQGALHSSLHRLEDGPTGFALFTDEQRRAMKAKQIAAIKVSQTKETRAKRAASVKRYWDNLSPEERAARNHRVLMVEKTDWRDDVWCMDVPGYENFFANGMVVHNCEHHMQPFFGKAHIAYVPDGKVVGVSKLARILDTYARRLQIQERLTQQVVDALMTHLHPKGAACIVEARHFCMVCRGVGKQNSTMVTSAMKGVFMEHGNPARAELFGLIRH